MISCRTGYLRRFNADRDLFSLNKLRDGAEIYNVYELLGKSIAMA